jgi:hypothetical protein
MTAAPAWKTASTAGPTVADVMHADCTALGIRATLAEVRDWFAGSASRRLALIADDAGRYVGALTRADAAVDLPDPWSAAQVARYGRTVSPDMTAAEGREEALRSPARRVAVVAADGRLLGVLAITLDARRFSCADAGSPD